MNQPTRIAVTAASHLAWMTAAAFAWTIAYEGLNWFLMWNEARKDDG